MAMMVKGVTPGLAAEITTTVSASTTGIAAGSVCDGQILVIEDMLGLLDWTPEFVRRHADTRAIIEDAVASCAADVRTRAFPADTEEYHLRVKNKRNI